MSQTDAFEKEKSEYAKFYDRMLDRWIKNRRRSGPDDTKQTSGEINEFVIDGLENNLCWDAFGGSINDSNLYASLGLLALSIGQHKEVGMLPETLVFLNYKNILTSELLTSEQQESLARHFSACKSCSELAAGFESLVPLYQEKFKKKVIKFHPWALPPFYNASLRLLGERLHANPIHQSFAETAVHLLNGTIDRHFGPFGQVADRMLFVATTPEYMPKYANPEYNEHLRGCGQCNEGMKNIGYGSSARLITHK